jgi:flagellum-specific peptidoglycan hydrolase FlgJ
MVVLCASPFEECHAARSNSRVRAMQVVPRVTTSLALTSIRPLIEAAFRAEDRDLSPIQAINLTALVALETARGKSIQNFNVGNITAAHTYTGPVWRPPWFEKTGDPKLDALHERMLAGTAPSAFRAYASHEEGAKDFARFMLTDKYASVMRAADQPDADTFRRALSERYSHDYENPASTASFRQLQRELGLASSVTPAAWLVLLALYLFRRTRRA